VQGPCLTCQTAVERTRPSASARGYTSPGWRALRGAKLATAPFCEAVLPDGSACRALATEVDHLRPHQGPLDPLFWEWTNLSSKCKPCHSYKTATRDSPFARRKGR